MLPGDDANLITAQNILPSNEQTKAEDETAQDPLGAERAQNTTSKYALRMTVRGADDVFSVPDASRTFQNVPLLRGTRATTPVTTRTTPCWTRWSK